MTATDYFNLRFERYGIGYKVRVLRSEAGHAPSIQPNFHGVGARSFTTDDSAEHSEL